MATLRQPMEHPHTAEFADGLDPVNSLGEASPGFVWRLQTEEGNATSLREFANPLTIPNLTVWEGVQPLKDFVYRGLHRDFFRKRADWFEPGSVTAMWWIPAGTLPTLDDAKTRLAFHRALRPVALRLPDGPSVPDARRRRPRARPSRRRGDDRAAQHGTEVRVHRRAAPTSGASLRNTSSPATARSTWPISTDSRQLAAHIDASMTLPGPLS